MIVNNEEIQVENQQPTQTNADPNPPSSDKVYEYYVSLYEQSGKQFNEERLRNISKAPNHRFWVDKFRKELNLKSLNDQEYNSVYDSWIVKPEVEKKNSDNTLSQSIQENAVVVQDGELDSQSVLENTTILSESEDSDEPSIEKELQLNPSYYIDKIDNRESLLPALKNLPADFLSLNEADAAIEFNLQLKKFGFHAEQAEIGSNALKITRPDGSQFDIKLMSGAAYETTIYPDEDVPLKGTATYDQRIGIKHNEFIMNLAAGNSSLVNTMASDFSTNPMGISEAINGYTKALNRPSEEDMAYLSLATTGAENPGMYMYGGEFDEALFMTNLLSVKNRLQPLYNKTERTYNQAVQGAVLQSVKTDNLRLPERGDGLTEEEKSQQKRVRETFLKLDSILKEHEARQRRTSRLIGNAIKLSGIDFDLNNQESMEALVSQGLNPMDMPLPSLKINGQTASFQDVYDVLSDVVELRYVRDGKIKLEIDQDADSGMFQEYVDMLAEKQVRNYAFEEELSSLKQFGRSLVDIPQGLYVHTMGLMNDFGHALSDALQMFGLDKEVADFTVFKSTGVIYGGGGPFAPGGLNFSFPSDERIKELEKLLPSYDRNISDARDAGEFLALGMDAATQSMPYTAAFLLNPGLGLSVTAIGTYGGEIDALKKSIEAAKEAKASGAILTEREQELLNMSNAEARLNALTKSGIETAVTAAFTGRYFKQLHLSKSFKNLPKNAATSQQLADAFARKHRQGLIASFSRYTGLDPQVVAKELPEEMIIAAFTYMTDVAFGLEVYDSQKMGKLMLDSGLSSLFTSIPMGVGGKFIGPNINKQSDSYIERKITIEGEAEAINEKLSIDNSIEKLKKKGLDDSSPEMEIAKNLSLEADAKVNKFTERKKQLVQSMTNADKKSFLQYLANAEKLKSTIENGNTPETIDGAIIELAKEKEKMSRLLSKYPSELSYYFLPEAEQKALRDRAMKEIEQEKIAEAEAKGGDFVINITDMDNEVIERAAQIYLDDVKNAKTENNEQVSVQGYFIENPSEYYTETTDAEAAEFDVNQAINTLESDLFNQPPAEEKTVVVETTKQEQKDVQEPEEESTSKTTAQFINRGGNYTDPVTGDVLTGDFYIDGQSLVFEEKNTGKVFEIGNANELATTPAEDVGIVYLDEKVQIKEDGTMLYDGKEYLIQTDLPTTGIEFDENNRVISVSVKEKDSDKRIKLTGQDAQDAALKIYLSEGQQLPDIEQKLEDNEEFQEEKRKASQTDAEAEANQNIETDTPKELTVEEEILRRNTLVERIKNLNKSNNFYNNLGSVEKKIVADFFKDIEKGRKPRFARVENIIRSQEIAYQLRALNTEGITIFQNSERISKMNKWYDAINPAWYIKNKVNPFSLLNEIYPLLNNEGRKTMTAFGRDRKLFVSNQMTADVLLGAIFRDTRKGQPMIDLVNSGNRKVAVSMNQAQDNYTEDLNLFRDEVREFNKTVPADQRIPLNLLELDIKKGVVPKGQTDTALNVDYEMQVLAHLKRRSGQIDQLSGLDTEFLRQKNALLSELEIRKEEFENNKDETSKVLYETLKNTLDRLGVADAKSFEDIASKARTPLLNALDRLAARFPHEDAMRRKLDYEGQIGTFFEKGSYVPTYRTTADGDYVADGRSNATNYDQMAGILEDITDDDNLENSRISFGNYLFRSYGQLRGALIDINARADFEALNSMVQSSTFRDIFANEQEYEMVQKYFSGRLNVFNGLVTQGQNVDYDYGNQTHTLGKAGQAIYTGISALALARLNQPMSQFYSAVSGTAPMLTDAKAKAHLNLAIARFPFYLSELGNGQKVNSGLIQKRLKSLIGGGNLSNLYAQSRTGLRNALKAEFAIDDQKLLPISYYATRFNLDDNVLNQLKSKAKYTIDGFFDAITKSSELSLEFFLANADRAAANASFEAHYMQHRADQGSIIPDSQSARKEWWKKENENPNIEAIQYADKRVAETMRQTDPTSEAEFYGKDASTRTKVSQRALFSWGKFQMNAKANFANQIARVNDPSLPEVERQEAMRRMRGIISEVATFNGIKNVSNYAILSGLGAGYFLLAGGDEDDVRRYGGMTQLITDALLPVESREYQELLKDMPREKAETLEQFKLNMRENASGLDTTLLELYQHAYEFENKITIGEQPNVVAQALIDAFRTAQPSPFLSIEPISGITYMVLNDLYGEDIIPEYVSRDVEKATKDADGLLLALKENAGIYSVGIESVDKLIRARRMHNEGVISKGVRATGQGEIVEYIAAPNEIMQKKLDAALDALLWGRLVNAITPGPKGDITKILNKLERQIEENFVVASPQIKGSDSLFVKFYIEHLTENRGVQIDPYNFGSWWEEEKKNLDGPARKYATEKLEEIRKKRIYAEK